MQKLTRNLLLYQAEDFGFQFLLDLLYTTCLLLLMFKTTCFSLCPTAVNFVSTGLFNRPITSIGRKIIIAMLHLI